jgi:hypothetical protein
VALTITSADVVDLAPELSGVTAPQWARVLDDVALEVGVGVAGSQQRADRMGLQLAAHLATVRYLLTSSALATGPLVSISAGGISKTFASSPAAVSPGAQAFMRTRYGQEYLRLTRLFGRRLEVL